MLPAILFDLDGTLTDPRDGIVRSIRHAVERLGIACPPDAALERYIGPPLHESFAELLGPARASEASRAVALYRERYAPVGMYENRVYPGIRELLGSLRAAGHRLIVCTSKPTVFAERIVGHFELAGFFEAIHGSELDGTRTDKRELMAHLLRATGLHGSAAVMVGDRLHDVAAARAHGLRAVGVLWGYGSADELRAAGADALVERPEDVAAAVQRENRSW
ncbi:HAD family hydrolase [Anaeromyxobacter oryzae]|uniref:Hydrolase n=1 Tax=Anaeromyxobacter oryzae TaxID=2918170 RepID=A0ABM7X129_9BACT|nr:HAD family hydrolase [Anaeromyxobacter oryzae]BDG05452.1 hydrolase [Anaeromyxobacter oryzae]